MAMTASKYLRKIEVNRSLDHVFWPVLNVFPDNEPMPKMINRRKAILDGNRKVLVPTPILNHHCGTFRIDEELGRQLETGGGEHHVVRVLLHMARRWPSVGPAATN